MLGSVRAANQLHKAEDTSMVKFELLLTAKIQFHQLKVSKLIENIAGHAVVESEIWIKQARVQSHILLISFLTESQDEIRQCCAYAYEGWP
jgi:hypothetical protein